MSLEDEYNARLGATANNLTRHLDQCIGIINTAQAGDMPSSEALEELTNLHEKWATLIVDDLAPKKHLL